MRPLNAFMVPTSYSYDWGPVHFIIIDNVHWSRDEENNVIYFSEVGERQLTFVRNDLAFVPKDQLVVISIAYSIDGDA